MDAFNYNVHELIKIRSNVDLSLVDRRLSYFRSEGKIEPDITIHVVKDFTVNVDEAIRLAPHFFGVENGRWVYYDRKLAVFKLKLLVKNLLDTTQIVATDFYLRMHFRIGRITPLWEILPFVMNIKLLKKGYTFLHGACISRQNKGALLCAFPNTGKTLTALLSLKNKHGFSYLSDDITIVDDEGYAYCYPEPHPFFGHAKGGKANEKDYIKFAIKLISPIMKIHVNEPIKQFTKIYSDIKNPKIDRKVKIANIFFLERTQENIKENTKEITAKKAYAKLVASNRHEFPYCTDPILLTYSYFNPEMDFDNLCFKERKILLSLIKHAQKFFILRSRNPEKFIDLVESVM